MTKAYIIIDLQNDYFPDGKFPLKNIDVATSNAAKFLEFARKQGSNAFKIIHVRHVFPIPEAPFFKEDTFGSQINEGVKPTDDELIITKNQPNSFLGTNLDQVLKQNGITELVVSGAMTNVCIQGTVRHASEIGYKVQLLKDAVTTRDWEFDGKVVDYESVNTAIFATLSFGSYAELLTVDDAINGA